MNLSSTEENYLKGLFKISIEKDTTEVGTNLLADHLGVKPATVNSMLKRLKIKALVDYEKYRKIRLTNTGKKIAIEIVRKHRLWETFLYKKLKFKDSEVHVIAEQLEHIVSKVLIDRMDEYLGYPKKDPHGDSIPDKRGKFR